MTSTDSPAPFSYSAVVGQESLKMALELCYIEPLLGGVLISGERGTGKSTTVRAFARLMYKGGAVTLPINATEDRVVGGWEISKLVGGEAVEKVGLLKQADGSLLYVDEVNLLDDHIVNLILDAASTGELSNQREGNDKNTTTRFALVGTMNPEEGALRPQLLDRFGLMVAVTSEAKAEDRRKILQQVLGLGEAISAEELAKSDANIKRGLDAAKSALASVEVPDDVCRACVRLATEFNSEGHRAELVMARAARALAALEAATKPSSKSSKKNAASLEHLRKVAPLALRHRRKTSEQQGEALWSKADDDKLQKELGLAPS